MQRSKACQEEGSNPGIGSTNSLPSEVRVETTQLNSGTRGSQLPSTGQVRRPKTLKIFDHDLPVEVYEEWCYLEQLSIDTETDGLEFRRDKLRLVQLCDSAGNVVMIRNPDENSHHVIDLLVFSSAKKIFHQAPFDLRFLLWNLKILSMRNIFCTKIASKMLYREGSTSLGSCLERELGVTIPKSKALAKSDWNAPELSQEQLEYAANDVLYLDELLNVLLNKMDTITEESYSVVMEGIMDHTVREISGYKDIYEYDGKPNWDILNRFNERFK